MNFVELYFAGFGLGMIPALAFFLLCGAYSAISEVSTDLD